MGGFADDSGWGLTGSGRSGEERNGWHGRRR